jgi:hypothetical protein
MRARRREMVPPRHVRQQRRAQKQGNHRESPRALEATPAQEAVQPVALLTGCAERRLHVVALAAHERVTMLGCRVDGSGRGPVVPDVGENRRPSAHGRMQARHQRVARQVGQPRAQGRASAGQERVHRPGTQGSSEAHASQRQLRQRRVGLHQAGQRYVQRKIPRVARQIDLGRPDHVRALIAREADVGVAEVQRLHTWEGIQLLRHATDVGACDRDSSELLPRGHPRAQGSLDAGPAHVK